jgi:N-acyl-D-aspartate/D-glutamate deacylase
MEEMQEREARRPRWERTFVSSYNPDVDGLSILDLGKKRNTSPEEALIDLLIEQNGEGFQISFGNTEENLAVALRQPWTTIGSDGSALSIGMRTALGKPHPRSFGTHARVLAKYVREENLISLAEAIRKMTSFPAARLGLADRGLLRPGMKADVVVFDPDRIQDQATFKEPEQYATGIEWVLINGRAVVEQGKPTGALPGRVLLGPGTK